MNQYVTGGIIKKMREERKLTQARLAELLNVSDKTISKWETGRGYPDITMLDAVSKALGLSVAELLSGENIKNMNHSFKMTRTKFYVCPICGNIVFSAGEAVISCCGIPLPVLEAEEPDTAHEIHIEKTEDEYYLSLDHEMQKEHYISFISAVRDDGFELRKLYPEGPAEARFKISRTKWIYYYCNRHGLFKVKI